MPQNWTADRGGTSTIQQVRQLPFVGMTTIEAAGFWIAVTLPVPTLGLLFVGVSNPVEMFAVTGLLCANLMAFYVGHDYSEPESDPHAA